jgi:4-amino-4-deoxy-L-arabinose transferase-like glycosyltransferase
MKKIPAELLIVLMSALFFIPFLGAVHLFDWDEINFAEAAREMLVSGDYFKVQIDFKPFWEKPPLFIWMQALSMKIFGVNEFAARFPNAIAGIATLVILYRIGKQYINEAFGWIWVMTYGGTILTLLYFKSGIIDPWFNLFIFLAIYFFSFLTEHDATQRSKRTLLAGVFLGLAVLTKGPVAILICVLCLLAYWGFYRMNTAVRFLEILAVVLITAAISFLWFGVELKNNGIWFIKEFVVYQIRLFQTQDAGHGGPFFYHWYVLLLGCFPASLFAIKAFFMKALAEEHQRSFFRWMEIMFWVVLILFSIVKTKIVHYSSLTYFPITFLASYALYFLIHGSTKWNNWIRVSQYIIGFLISFLLIVFPIAMKNVNQWQHIIKDPFAQANLQANIDWAWYDSIGGFILLAGMIGMLVMNKDHHYRRAAVILYLSLTTAVFFTSVLIVPKVEAFSQRSAIEFYQSLKGKDVYVQPMYFKSYAHLFYFERGPLSQPQAYDHEWLRSGNIDKDLYIVVKVTMRPEIERYKDIQFIREENGFAFYLRKQVQKSPVQ